MDDKGKGLTVVSCRFSIVEGLKSFFQNMSQISYDPSVVMVFLQIEKVSYRAVLSPRLKIILFFFHNTSTYIYINAVVFFINKGFRVFTTFLSLFLIS